MTLVIFGLGGCTDKAKVGYLRCEALHRSGDLAGAVTACEAARAADPKSLSGRSAAQLLPAMTAKIAAQAAETEEESRAAEAAGAAERMRLAASASPDDWRALISKYPGSPEAQSVEPRLDAATSVCANLASWRLEVPLRRAARFGDEVSAARKTHDALEGRPAVTIRSIAAKAVDDARTVRQGLAVIQAHAAKPGEDPIRSALVVSYQMMVALDETWIEGLSTPDVSAASVSALVKRTAALDGRITESEDTLDAKCTALANEPPDGG